MAELAVVLGGSRTFEVFKSIQVALAFVYLYHCILTMSEEVRYIWSRRISVGKVLYLAARYFPVIREGLIFSVYIYSRKGFGIDECFGVYMTVAVLAFSSLAASHGSLLLCIYALLGARRRYMVFLLLVYMTFCVPSLVLVILYHANTVVLKGRDPTAEYSDWPCVATAKGDNSYPAGVVAVYLACTLAMITITSSVLFVRYRRQSNSLINSIRRDGGLFYCASFSIRLLYAITTLHGFSAQGRIQPSQAGATFERLDGTLGAILATTLILNLRHLDDPTSRSVVSALVFAVDRDLQNVQGDEEDIQHHEGEGTSAACTSPAGRQTSGDTA